MADTVPITAGSGTTIATDDCAGVHYQRVKLVDGTADSTALIPGDATNGLDVDVTRVIPGTSATHLGKAEDAAHSSGDVGVMVLGVRNDAAMSLTELSGTAGDYTPIATDKYGAVRTNSGIGLEVTGSVTSASNLFSQDCSEFNFVSIHITSQGTSSTVTFEGSNDNSNWVNHQLNNSASGNTTTNSTTASNAFSGPILTKYFRARVSGISAGTTACTAEFYYGAKLQPQSTVQILGNAAHDSTDSGSPVKIGGKAIAHGSNPTAVAAADRSDFYCNRHGIPFVIGGHMNVVTASARITSSNTDAALLPGTISSGTKIVITRMHVAISNATTINVGVKVGFGTSTLPADNATGVADVIVDNDGFPPGGGVQIGDGSGIIAVGGDGAELRITNDAPTSGSIHLNYSYYTIES